MAPDTVEEGENTTGRHRVAIIGAGPGGICAAIRLIGLGYEDFVVLEQATGVGGTWFHNRYPGAECDVMSHLYCYSFEPNPEWSQRYAPQPEILAYLEHCVEKYDVRSHLQLATRVMSARWDESSSTWQLDTNEGRRFEVDIVVSAVGMFNEISTPDIEGLETFSGSVLHSARWPSDPDLGGRRVAVVGSAASAVQLIPEVARVAGHLAVFQRTPIWVLPKDHRPYTDEDRLRFRAHPEELGSLRAEIEALVNQKMTFADPETLAQGEAAGLANIAVVEDVEVRRKLTPTLPWGSRRPVTSSKYYPVFNQPNVELVTEKVAQVTPRGIRTVDGHEHPVDVLVLATGFNTTRFASVIDVTGRAGLTLQEAWSDDPVAFLGMVTAGFPNFFMLYGPNTNNGSILRMLEYQVDFIVRLLQEMDQHDLLWVDIRKVVMTDFNRGLHADLGKVGVWQPQHDGYYRGRSGRIVTQWPHTMDEYAARLREIPLMAFEYARR